MGDKGNTVASKILHTLIYPEEVITGGRLATNTFCNHFLKNLIFFGVLSVIGMAIDLLFFGLHDRVGLFVEVLLGLAADVVLALLFGLIDYWWAKVATGRSSDGHGMPVNKQVN